MDPRDESEIGAWPLRRGVTEAVLASRFTTVSSRNGQRRSSRTIGLLAFVVNRQIDESSVVRTRNDVSLVTALLSVKADRSGKERHDARARKGVIGELSRLHSSCASTRRWLKVNSHDETTTMASRAFPGRRSASEARGAVHLSPDGAGRERPPRIRASGQVCTLIGGSLTPRH
jgi:hypothetical protein